MSAENNTKAAGVAGVGLAAILLKSCLLLNHEAGPLAESVGRAAEVGFVSKAALNSERIGADSGVWTHAWDESNTLGHTGGSYADFHPGSFGGNTVPDLPSNPALPNGISDSLLPSQTDGTIASGVEPGSHDPWRPKDIHGPSAETARRARTFARSRSPVEDASAAHGAETARDAFHPGDPLPPKVPGYWSPAVARALDPLSSLDRTWQPLADESVRVEKLVASDPEAVTRKVNGVHVVAILPSENAAFQNVFNVARAGALERDLFRAQAQLRNFPGASAIGSVDQGLASLNTAILTAPDTKCTIIIGHSEEIQGVRCLRLPDGGHVAIDDVHQIALDAKKPVAVLTCFSEDFNLSSQISYEEAFTMCEAGEQLFARSGTAIKTEEMVLAMRQRMVTGRVKKVAITAAATTAGGTGVALVTARFNAAE